jgi:glucose-6-phosphate isomerase
VVATSDSDVHDSLIQAHRLLNEYKLRRRESELGSILSTAKRLRDKVDRVVIVAPVELIEAAEALFQACCHPYHNQLSRGQRGGRPRVFFAPARPDNDAIGALLDILPQRRLLNDVEDCWGLVAIGECDNEGNQQSSEVLTGIFKLFWDALQQTTTANTEAERAVAIGCANSAVVDFAKQIGIPTIETDGPSADLWFHPGVLFAAAVMGMNIVKLLRGAAVMEQRFATALPGNNSALDFGGVCYLLAARKEIRTRRIETGIASLQRLAANLQRLDGQPDLLIQWVVDEPRHDRMTIATATDATKGRRSNDRQRAVADILHERDATMRAERISDGKPTVVIRLPTSDEGSVGQLIVMFQMAEAIEISLNESDSEKS